MQNSAGGLQVRPAIKELLLLRVIYIVNRFNLCVQVRPPADACPETKKLQFQTIEDLFSEGRAGSVEAQHYRAVIERALDMHAESTGAVVGACLMEPLLQGAGGMLLIDPLFQRVIVEVRCWF